jgi:hypothetical protein
LAYRDSILKKAVYALLQQTDSKGQFFPINDSQKGMSWKSRELITAVDMAYQLCGQDPALLSIAKEQGRVTLDESGFLVSRDISKGLAKPFPRQSIRFVDGEDGKQGGIGILRMPSEKNEELCLVLKYSAQGMGHGHFDKLSYSLYDGIGEIVQDYGAARWVNVDQKGGGRYLPENNTFAKQSIGHNTLFVNENSHYKGDIEIAEKFNPDLYFFSVKDPNLKSISAFDSNSDPGTTFHRTMILFKEEAFERPLVLDICRVKSDSKNQYDYPTWFQGHLMASSFEYKTNRNSLSPLGEGNGYQHIWLEALGKSNTDNAQFTWFNNGSFFTQTMITGVADDLIFGRLGANDPEFNLRSDPVFIHRKKGASDALFFSLIEPHGYYTPVEEIPENPYPQITQLEVVSDSPDYTILGFKAKNGKNWFILLANKNAEESANHEVIGNGKRFNWQGPIKITGN